MITQIELSTKSIPGDLFGYQKEDLEFLLKVLKESPGALNLSEMGTGKTPVAMGLAKLGGFKKTLIVCPKTLRYEWSNQINTWLGIQPTVSSRSSVRRVDELAEEFLGNSPDNPFFIVNYETFRSEKHWELLNIVDFDLVIMDEGHKVRNHTTHQFKGLRDFLDSHSGCTKVLTMTGSPIVNSPDDLYTLLTLTLPLQFPARERYQWLSKYCYVVPRRNRVKVIGIKNREGIGKEIAPFTVKRSKKEVLPYLPDKYFRKVVIDMGIEQREMYDKCLNELVIELEGGEKIFSGSVLALLTRLREINLDPAVVGKPSVSSSKTDFLVDLLEEIGDQKLVIFSCFEGYIDFLDRKFSSIPHVN